MKILGRSKLHNLKVLKCTSAPNGQCVGTIDIKNPWYRKDETGVPILGWTSNWSWLETGESIQHLEISNALVKFLVLSGSIGLRDYLLTNWGEKKL